MTDFEQIRQLASKRKGGEQALQALLPPTPNPDDLLQHSDDRMLSMMTQCIFQAGFVWRVVNTKWPEFEQAFQGFDTHKMAYLAPEELDMLAKDERIIRNMTKIATVPRNALWIIGVAEQYGGFAEFLRQWPDDDQVGLMQLMKRQGARLGGVTGQRFLRQAGFDAFILTQDVLQALRNSGIDFNGSATSMEDLKQIQSAFNEWRQQSGLSYTHISKILAFSTGENVA